MVGFSEFHFLVHEAATWPLALLPFCWQKEHMMLLLEGQGVLLPVVEGQPTL